MTRKLLTIAALVTAGAGAVVPQYFLMGFTHILPGGLDHILFILGLFFMTREFAPLLFQMTLFTLAHSLTLGLSIYGFLSVPERAVEIAIALSIAFIGMENLFSSRLRSWRPAVVFCFGLIHGLGFAHSFQRNSVDPGDFLPALFSFNIGIECGQLAVVALAYAAVAVWWKRDFYRTAVARPASMAIAASGIYWAVERSF